MYYNSARVKSLVFTFSLGSLPFGLSFVSPFLTSLSPLCLSISFYFYRSLSVPEGLFLSTTQDYYAGYYVRFRGFEDLILDTGTLCLFVCLKYYTRDLALLGVSLVKIIYLVSIRDISFIVKFLISYDYR